MQLAVYPEDIDKPWINVDRTPNAIAQDNAFKVFQGLYELVETEQRTLRFSQDAQEIFDEWRTELEAKIRASDIHPALESHLAKYRSLMPSLALLIQLAEDPNAIVVSKDCAIRAVYWCAYLESHARRIYNMGIDLALSNAHLIFNRRGKLPSPFKIRDITNKKWMGLPEKKTVEPALEILIDHDYIREERIESPGGGRPSLVYHWNPNILNS